jgi:ketosteroid isomerase-like protein
MAHPLEAIIREAYAAFGRGDVDGYLRACTSDFTFNIPGQSAISGTFHGKEGIYDLARKAMEFTGGTFDELVEDVLANDQHAVVLARHRFTRDGQVREYRTAHVYEIRDGKPARCFEQPRDYAAFEDAWGRAGVGSQAAKP